MFNRFYLIFGSAVFILLTSPFAKSVDYEHELLNENDGIASSIIFSIQQDESGFLWLGTGYNGILRYDGKNIVNYLHTKVGDGTSLPHNNAGNIFLDQSGQMWIGSWGGGLIRFDPKNETFEQHLYSARDFTSVGSNSVQVIFQDRSERYWIGTYTGGLNEWLPDADEFRRLPVYNAESNDENNGSSHARIWDIEQDIDGDLWLASDHGFNRFKPQNDHFQRFYPSAYTGVAEHDRVRRLIFESDNRLILGTQNGLLRFDSKNQKYQIISSPNFPDIGPVYSIIKTSFNEYWVTTDYGVFSFNERTDLLKKVPLNFDDRCSQTLFEDKQGIIWLSCEGVGLYKITRKSVFNIIPEPDLKSAYSLKSANNDDVFIGTSQSGLLRWDPSSEKLSVISKFEDEIDVPDVNFIAQSQQGDIWFSDNQTIFRINSTGEQFRLNPPEHLQSLVSDIRDLETDEQGNLWVITPTGLHVIDYRNNQFEYFSLGEISNIVFQQNVSSRLYLGPNNRMWLSFGNSLYFATSKVDGFTELTSANLEYETDGFANLIYSMHIDSQKRMWIGNKQGLFQVNPVSGERQLVSTFFNERDNQGIRYITEDGDGFLWFITAIGVSRFNPTNKELRHFDKRDGLPGSRYYYNPTTRSSDGHVYLSSRDGVFHFDPLSIKDKPAQEATILTNFEVLGNDQRFNVTDIIQNGISLAYNQSNVKFEFATLDLLNARQIQYSYKLDGFDKGWIDNGSNSSATYTNLSGGRYIFRVKSRVKQNLWYEQELAIDVEVATPIWKRNWMFGVYFCLIILLIAIYIKRQKQAVIELERQVADKTADIALESKKLAAANRIKSQFLANMSHEIRTPLTTVIGQAEAIICRDIEPQDIYKEVEIIHDSGVYLLALLNDILDVTKIEENKFELEYSPQDLHVLLENINTMFSMQAKVKGLTFSLTQNLPTPFVINADGLRLKQILINLLSNALKFTIEGSVELIVNYDKEQLTFSVVDTGIGISEDQVEQIFRSFTQGDSSIRRRFGGSGLGLHLSNQLAGLMKGSIKVSSALNKGSTFVFSMPVPDMSNGLELLQGTLDFDTLAAKPLFDGGILLAEDHDDNRRLITRLLKKLGLTVYTARDGFEAITLFEEHLPEVVLMDIQMPRMDGIQAFKRLRELGYEVPIIALTANAMQSEVEAYFDLGFDGYIQKPIDRHLLITTIATFFKSKDEDSMNRATSVLGNIDMSDLVVKFQEGLSQDLQTLNECASKEDVQAIRVNVHKISGAAQLFGFSELSELSSALEQLIKSGATEMSEIQRQYNKLIKEIEKNSTSLSN